MICWTEEAWADYEFWLGEDKKTIKRINALIKEVIRTSDESGMGKPELLRFELQGLKSRRIDEKNRLVYAYKEGTITIFSCRYHYSK